LGIAGGIYYNSSSTSTVKTAVAKPDVALPAAAEEVKIAFSPKEFRGFKVNIIDCECICVFSMD
jgi:hypothetical protein